MNYSEQLAIQAKRYKQLDRDIISRIYKLIKENTGDTELALTVSLQLQRQDDYLRLQKEKLIANNKSLSTRLHEIADAIDDNYNYNDNI